MCWASSPGRGISPRSAAAPAPRTPSSPLRLQAGAGPSLSQARPCCGPRRRTPSAASWAQGQPPGHLRRARRARPRPPARHSGVPGQGAGGRRWPAWSRPAAPRREGGGRQRVGPGVSGTGDLDRDRALLGGGTARRAGGKSWLLPPAPLPPGAGSPFSPSSPPPSLPGFPQPPAPAASPGHTAAGPGAPRGAAQLPLPLGCGSRGTAGAEQHPRLETNPKPLPHLDSPLGPRTLSRSQICHAGRDRHPDPSEAETHGRSVPFPPLSPPSALPHGCNPCPHGRLSPRYPGWWVSCHASVRVSRYTGTCLDWQHPGQVWSEQDWAGGELRTVQG